MSQFNVLITEFLPGVRKINKKINGGSLHLATSNGHLSVVKELISFGADVNLRDKNLRTPLFCALYGKREERAAAISKKTITIVYSSNQTFENK